MSDPAVWWGASDYELVVREFEPIYDRLVERLEPRPAERWLDVATGTGEVAVRAARAGAEVTGIDLAPAMIEQARSHPEPVRWEVGDVQELPYDDGSFDVVSSNFGAVFAPDAERTAAELTRVCRRRLGLTAWEHHPEREIWDRHSDEIRLPEAWATEEQIRDLLPAFELEIERHTWYLEGESFELIWDWVARAFPPHRERLGRMDPEQVESVRREIAELYERHRENGVIRYPRPYLLAVGVKR
jgi:SAM-dependent methyltransferase